MGQSHLVSWHLKGTEGLSKRTSLPLSLSPTAFIKQHLAAVNMWPAQAQPRYFPVRSLPGKGYFKKLPHFKLLSIYRVQYLRDNGA